MNKKIFSIFLVLYLVLSIHVYSLFSHSSLYSFLQTILYHGAGAIVVASGIFAVSRFGTNSPRGRIFMYLTAGMIFWFIGDLLFTLLENLGISTFPSVADFFYLLGYPFLAFGIFSELKMQKLNKNIREAWRFYLLAFLMVIIAAFVLFGYSFGPKNSLIEEAINALYCLGDILIGVFVVFILAIIDQYKQGKFSETWICLLVGILFTFVADMLFAIFYAQYNEGAGLAREIDLLYIVSYVFIAYGFFSAGNMIEQAKERIVSGLK